MKKRVITLWLLIFIGLFISPHFLQSVIGDDNYENTENREMAKAPKLMIETIENFPNDFETYYNDTLPFRSELITANSYINYLLFQESNVGKVIVGKDRWLFFNPKGGDSDSIGDYRGENYLTESELFELLNNLQQVNNQLSENGKEFVVFIAPNKESLYGTDYLPEKYKVENPYTTADQVVDFLRCHSDLRIVYPKKELTDAMTDFPEYDFYYNTDTHWNELGAYVGTKALVEELGGEMEDVSRENVKYAGILSKGLDLANMMKMSEYICEENAYYVTPKTDVKHILVDMERGAEYYNFSTNATFRFLTDSNNKKKVFVLRDSFGVSMAEYMSLNFAELVMVHRAQYEPMMVKEENPDIVVYEIVERYIRTLSWYPVQIE